MGRLYGVLSLLVLVIILNIQQSQSLTCKDFPSYAFCNYTLPIAHRVNDLVKRLTVTEKLNQMVHKAPEIARLGIPAYGYWSEGLHGILHNGTTSFPQVIGLGAAFNATLYNVIAKAIATEARALFNIKEYVSLNGNNGGLTFFAPNINIYRDPRWGRGQETPGEDPLLTSEYAVAYVRGLQEGEDPRYLKLAATCKHYQDYDMEDWGGIDRYHFDAIVSDRDQIETFFPPFEACVRDGKVKSIMCSYNSVNGVPACANPLLLQDILREQYGFDGYVVSDCGAIDCIMNTHNYTTNIPDTCAVAIKNGCDMECGDYYLKCTEGLTAGTISPADIDIAFAHLFTHRFELGLFDPLELQTYTRIPISVVDSPDFRNLALAAAHQTIVLLKNEKNFLPLHLTKYNKIAIIGPNANSTEVLLGNYHGDPNLVVTPLRAFIEGYPSIQFTYAKGCEIQSTNISGFASAVTAAKASQIAIMFVGIDGNVCDEGHDRNTIDLPGVQSQLVQAVVASGTPVIVVLINGAPLAIEWIADNVPAIIEAWYPGEQGGNAITDVIFGLYNPGGRLPLTFYPTNYVTLLNMTNMDMRYKPGRTYKFFTGDPVYEFGHGLSYTQFQYSWIEAPENAILSTTLTQAPSFRVKVTNIGSLAGDDVVLCFISNSDPDAPIKELIGFKRIHLNKGESREVFFAPKDLKFLSVVEPSGKRLIKPSHFKVMIGELVANFKLKGPIVEISNPVLDILKKSHKKVHRNKNHFIHA